jgi:hypothetical protein
VSRFFDTSSGARPDKQRTIVLDWAVRFIMKTEGD